MKRGIITNNGHGIHISDGAEKDRTYYLASDCFRNNRHHWCFSPSDRIALWLGRVQ